ncbi:MAG: hypothetical protein AAB036_07605 [Elusimicrobiota bacterium]
MTGQSERRQFWGVFCLALLLRLAYAWTQGPPLPIVGDAMEYRAYALNLAESGRYLGPAGEAATRMPGYPLFLAALHLLFGSSVTMILVVQCVLGALTCALLMRLAAEFLPAPWPLACGLISAGYFDLIEPSALLLTECLYACVLALSAWALYHRRWPPLRRALVYGLCSGALYLIRPEPLPYILGTCLLLPYLFADMGRKEIGAALLGAALVAGVWVGRNALVFHRFLPGSSVGQNVKYIALYLPAERQGLASSPRHVAPTSLGELERDAHMSRIYRELAASMTWTQRAKARLYNLLSVLYPFLPSYDWSYMTLFPFWLLGSWRAARRKPLWPLVGAVFCSLCIFPFFGGPVSRYRQGISPFIVVLAVVGLHDAAQKLGTGRLLRWAGGWWGANAAVYLWSAQFRDAALYFKTVMGWR